MNFKGYQVVFCMPTVSHQGPFLIQKNPIKLEPARGLQSVPRGFLGDWPRHGWARARWLQLCGIGGHLGSDAATLVATQPV